MAAPRIIAAPPARRRQGSCRWHAGTQGKDQAFFKVQVARTRLVDGTKESAYYLQGIVDFGKKVMVWEQTITREAFAKLG